ncbi:hypothetical protein FXB40_43390 [Bradyrhizobium rifense]|uniref:Uncharacterized protein n=1 Tax=Bradyrhizobium rifense TaxID=515499 RepID=A0A5D3KAG6_9BRAD|nr:hypothetical protein FXB40_43390 [Bradyrhizobium rifense]
MRCVATPSSRAQRSNPESLRGKTLDCFVARAPRNDEVETQLRILAAFLARALLGRLALN